jgi:hypothetical protein
MPRVATKLAVNKGGCYFARKRIPEDVQADYKRLYGIRAEARFTAPQGTPTVLARAKHREWLTEIEARIQNIRAEHNGEGQMLTPKDARALAGEWYLWFVGKYEDDPGDPVGCVRRGIRTPFSG